MDDHEILAQIPNYDDLIKLDKEVLQQALDLIEATQSWDYVQEDPDWHLHMAQYHLKEAINGAKWV